MFHKGYEVDKIDLIKLAYLGLRGLDWPITNESWDRVYRFEGKYQTNWSASEYDYALIEREINKKDS